MISLFLVDVGVCVCALSWLSNLYGTTTCSSKCPVIYAKIAYANIAYCSPCDQTVLLIIDLYTPRSVLTTGYQISFGTIALYVYSLLELIANIDKQTRPFPMTVALLHCRGEGQGRH